MRHVLPRNENKTIRCCGAVHRQMAPCTFDIDFNEIQFRGYTLAVDRETWPVTVEHETWPVTVEQYPNVCSL